MAQELKVNLDTKDGIMSLFHPRIFGFDFRSMIFAPIKKLFMKSPIEENNVGTTEKEICQDLEHYFKGAYERALVNESFDYNLQHQKPKETQNQSSLQDINFSIEAKTDDFDQNSLIEEDPYVRSY